MTTRPDIERIAFDALQITHQGLRLAQPDGVDAIAGSIERSGLLQPLVANRVGKTTELLDGFKRREALLRLGHDDAPVRVVALDPVAATVAIATFNAPHRGLAEIEEAWLVRTLLREHGLRQTEIATLMGRHKTWVCRRLQLVERLDPHVVDDMRLGLVSATVARELVRLPRGNQPQVARIVAQQGLTTRQSARLVGRLLECPDKQARDALLADPLRFITPKATTERRTRDARLDEATDAVRRKLVSLERSGLAVAQLSALAVFEDLGSGPRSIVAEHARAALHAVHRAIETLEPMTDTTLSRSTPHAGELDVDAP